MYLSFPNATALSSSRQKGLSTPDSNVMSVAPRILQYQLTDIRKMLFHLVPPSPFFSLCLFLAPAVRNVVQAGPVVFSGSGAVDLSQGELAWLALELLVCSCVAF